MKTSMPRGYWGIGIYHPKREENVGTLWRSAHAFGAAFIFTVGRRYQPQNSDTTRAWQHVPLFHFDDLDGLNVHSAPIIGIEFWVGAHDLRTFVHPERAIYLLGAEDHGLPPNVLEHCHATVAILGAATCLNVASAGSIVAYDRVTKGAANYTHHLMEMRR